MLLPEPSTGRFDGARHLFAVRVYFEDTDLSGVVYHANYLRWFERARSDLLRMLGIEQRAAHDAGEGAYAVVDVTMRFLKPARLDDVVVIESRADHIASASCRVLHRAFRGENLLCEATVRIAFVAPNSRPRRQPTAWVEAFRAFAANSSVQPSEQQGFLPA